jgi:hypothetical protein
MTTDELRKEYEKLRAGFDAVLPNVCGNCESTADLQIHHVVPLAFGGRNVITNLTRLCTSCHAAAHGGMSLVKKGRESLNKRVASGRNGSGSTPIGYEVVDGHFVINADKADLVRFIFRMKYEANLGAGTIANMLNHLAIPTVKGRAEWKHPSVLRILANKAYLGERYHLGELLDVGMPAILDDKLIAKVKRYEDTPVDARHKPARWPVKP